MAQSTQCDCAPEGSVDRDQTACLRHCETDAKRSDVCAIHRGGLLLMLDTDGSYGTGGSQPVRNALAPPALTGTAIRIRSIRAKRDRPGSVAQRLIAG